jgi:hypothetical protein
LGRVWSEHQAEFGQSSREDNQISGNLASDRGIFIYEFVGLCDDYVIYFHVVDKFNFLNIKCLYDD